MNNYEGLLILKPDLEKEEISILYQKIVDNIKKYGGIVENTEEWGKKTLAYKIGRYKEGIYYLIKFKSEPKQIKLLNSDFKLSESIIRVMFTRC